MSRLTVRRRTLLAALALAAPVRAQTWPTRPVRLIVPFAPGGGTDVTTRLWAPKVSEILGQPVVVENRAGAGGVIGVDFVSKQPPTGDVLGMATLSQIGLAPGLPQPMPFDPVTDLTPVAPTVFVPVGLGATRRGLEVETAQALIQLLRNNPGKYQYGSAGVGTSGHIACATFARAIGAEVLHVPYRGSGPVFAALAAGEVHYTFDIASLLKPLQEAGTARILFMATDQRSSLVPEVPTAREIGLPDYRAYSWYGVFGPAGLPQPIVARMAAAVEQALSDPVIQQRFEQMGTPAMRGYTPERFAAFVRSENATWAPLVRSLGITE
ncbi:Bug family tripartite tricarboxylate transporter substrate binding protein [Elioraea sp.]|uniref:Bug family tripartite tricarboxylate transporter substrate binding protein n=1 Tax=Elioraea sp. TaxID=2185103 RepID=UPI003F703011